MKTNNNTGCLIKVQSYKPQLVFYHSHRLRLSAVFLRFKLLIATLKQVDTSGARKYISIQFCIFFYFGNIFLIFLLLVLIFKSIIFELLHNSLVIREKEESKGGHKKTKHAKISKNPDIFYLFSVFCFCNHRFEMHPFFITDEFSKINRNKCILRFPLNQSIFDLVLSKI